MGVRVLSLFCLKLKTSTTYTFIYNTDEVLVKKFRVVTNNYLSRLLFEVDLPPLRRVEGVGERVEAKDQVEPGSHERLQN